MSHQSESARFRAIFESAIQAYEKKVGINLAHHHLSVLLWSCDSVESISTLLQCQVQAFSDFRENDKTMKYINTTVSIMTQLSSVAPLADAVGPVRQKDTDCMFISDHLLQTPCPLSKLIPACLAILLDVCAIL